MKRRAGEGRSLLGGRGEKEIREKMQLLGVMDFEDGGGQRDFEGNLA